MKSKNYKIVSLYSFFPFQENLIFDLKNKLLNIENENDHSGLLIFASEGINGTICAEKNVIDFVINLLNKYAGKRNLNIKVNFSKEAQILCFQCGANSIFYGDELLTTSNPSFQSDRKLLKEVGVSFNENFENYEKSL